MYTISIATRMTRAIRTPLVLSKWFVEILGLTATMQVRNNNKLNEYYKL